MDKPIGILIAALLVVGGIVALRVVPTAPPDKTDTNANTNTPDTKVVGTNKPTEPSGTTTTTTKTPPAQPPAQTPAQTPAQPPASKPKPVALSANDVSILFPPPQTKDDMKTVISIGELGGVFPDAAFANVVALANSPAGSVRVSDSKRRQIGLDDEFKTDKTKWHIAGIRIDPSAPGVSDAIRKQFGTSPQIRLILNPVTVDDQPTVHDFAIHLIYSYPVGVDEPLQPGCLKRAKPNTAAFKAIVADFTKLKVDLSTGQLGGTTVSTDGKPLGVHPGLANAATRMAVRDRIKAVLLDHLAKGKLVAMAVMGIENGFEPWIFLALQLDPATGKYNPVPAPSAIQDLTALQSKDASKLLFSQMLSFVDQIPVLPEPANNNQSAMTCQFYGVPKEARAGVSTLELFGKSPKKDRVRPVVDVIADPVKSHFFNTDCISCHTETHREITLLNTKSFAGLDDKVLPADDWNVRNFGWFRTNKNANPVVATATRRTETETAEVLSCINDLDACFARVP